MRKNLILALIAAVTILCGNAYAAESQPILPGNGSSVRKATVAQIYRYAREMYRTGQYPEAIKAFKEMLTINCESEVAQYHLMKIAKASPQYADLNTYLKNLPCELHNFEEEDFLPASLYYETDTAIMQEQLGYYNKRYRIAKDSLESATDNYSKLTKELEEEITSLRKQLANTKSIPTPTASESSKPVNTTKQISTKTESKAETQASAPVKAAVKETQKAMTAELPPAKTSTETTKVATPAEAPKPKAAAPEQAKAKTTTDTAKVATPAEAPKPKAAAPEQAKAMTTTDTAKVATPAEAPKPKAAVPEQAKAMTTTDTAKVATPAEAPKPKAAVPEQAKAKTTADTAKVATPAEAPKPKAAVPEQAKAKTTSDTKASTPTEAPKPKAIALTETPKQKAAINKEATINPKAKNTAKEDLAIKAFKEEVAKTKTDATPASPAKPAKPAKSQPDSTHLKAQVKMYHQTFVQMDKQIADLKCQLAEERVRHQDEIIRLRQKESLAQTDNGTFMEKEASLAEKDQQLATLEQKFAAVQAKLRSIEEDVKNKNAAIRAMQKEVDAATAGDNN